MTRSTSKQDRRVAKTLLARGFGIAATLLFASCDAGPIVDGETAVEYETKVVLHGNAERGRALVASGVHGCAACHAISSLKNARGIVGPRLDGFAGRGYIAGVAPNQPGQLVAFLQNPPAIAPRTAMPMLGITDMEARDIAAFLYTLKEGER